MKTRYLTTENDQNEEATREAGRIIREGGIVAFPTETVYGLGGDALNPESAKKIYAAKGRPSDNPLIVHICRLEDLERIARVIPQTVYNLADAFWPGPLTMIMEKKDIVPDETTGGLATVAVRFPSHPVAQALIREAGGFVAAPSANLSGKPSPTNGKHCFDDLDGRVDMVLDGGEVGIGLESTIVDLTGPVPEILRPGFVTKEDLLKVLGEVRVDGALLSDDDGIAPRAPGMKYRHYAPLGAMTLVSGEPEAVAKKINEILSRAKAEGKKTGVLCTEETGDRYLADLVLRAGKKDDEEEIARRLFSLLRTFDEEGVEVICSETFPEEKLGLAIMNRLKKAAGGNMIAAKEQ